MRWAEQTSKKERMLTRARPYPHFSAPPRAARPWPATTESAGTDVAIALPLIAGGITLYKDDWTGVGGIGA